MPLVSPRSTTPTKKQKIAQALEICNQTHEIKAQIRCDDRSFQFKPVHLKGQWPSFRQLSISTERTLQIPNLKELVDDVRSDRGGRYYIQIREDKFKTFGKILDQHLNDEEYTWNIELDDLGKFEVNDPYQSISTGNRQQAKSRSSLETSMKTSLLKTLLTALSLKTRLDGICPHGSPERTHDRTAPLEPPKERSLGPPVARMASPPQPQKVHLEDPA